MNAIPLFVLALLGTPPAATPEAFPAGVVVEEVNKELAGGMAGLRAGDVLLSWSRPDGGGRTIQSPFDLKQIDLEELPLHPVTLRGLRAAEPLTLVAPVESWGLSIKARPAFPEPLLGRYERGRALVREGKVQEGTALWQEVAAAAKNAASAACWLLGQAAAAQVRGRLPSAPNAYRDAIACAGKLGAPQLAALLDDQARAASDAGQLAESMDAYVEALRIRREAGSSAVARWPNWFYMALVAVRLGQRERGRDILQEALAALEAEAPQSLSMANLLALRGARLTAAGDLDAASEAVDRAHRIAEGLAPEGPTFASVLSAEGMVANARGDLATCERLWRRRQEIYRKIAPDGMQYATGQLNLGSLALQRGDLDAAAEWFRGALSTAEGTGSTGVTYVLLLNLGVVALQKGDLTTAEDFLRRGLAKAEAYSPGSQYVVGGLNALGETVSRRGDQRAASELLKRALELSEKLAPAGTSSAEALTTLGEVAGAEGDWNAAEGYYSRARDILQRLAPASGHLAHVLHGLGSAQRGRGKLPEAAALFASAIEALEAQRGRLGGSDEARSLFASRFFGVYQDQIELMVAEGRVAEAFHVLERSRARSLLTLMAERDLLLADDLPPELERERRRVDAEYERTRAELGALSAEKDAAPIDKLTLRLRELRDRQAQIWEKVREASPRLAEFSDPRPLDLAQVRASLDPGIALLAYSVGKERTVLFVLSAVGIDAVTLPLGEAQLRARIERWRRLAERTAPSPEFLAEARALYDVLVRPVEHRLSRAQRWIISPDGALHRLPFAALRRGDRYLAQWKSLGFVPSGTILAQLVRSRGTPAHATDLVAFADAHHPDMDALATSRREAKAIARLFRRTAVYLGEEATEERAKALGKGVRYVHFASHGLIDERFPMDSALVLTTPASAGEGRDNGRLHAWEIFERVRLDADLVTLSACRSASGAELAGEGLIGLTRAFHYAGARSVLASLWSVGDQSSLEFMARFYGLLKQGLPKDEALRRAQVAAIRGGRNPVRWAAFQLYGDWR